MRNNFARKFASQIGIWEAGFREGIGIWEAGFREGIGIWEAGFRKIPALLKQDLKKFAGMTLNYTIPFVPLF